MPHRSRNICPLTASRLRAPAGSVKRPSLRLGAAGEGDLDIIDVYEELDKGILV